MSSHERWTALLDILGRDGRLDVAGAAAELRVSAATIRRDLDQLGSQQLLTRTRGGAAPASVAYDLPLRYKASRHAELKERIGSAVAELIPIGSVLGINGGTTTSEVVRALVSTSPPPTGGPAADDAPMFTVVTNALNIANDLAVRRTVKLVVTGGVARTNSYELIGPFAEPTLRQLQLDFAVLGVEGLDPVVGATGQHEGEAAVNALMVSQARHIIVAADSSKIGQRRFVQICPIEAVHTLVTDDGADPDLVSQLVAAGVRVVLA